MTASKGYYSVIQYCPDPARLEAANVGVLLFCPGLKFIGARTAQGNGRVRRFFGNDSFDRRRLNSAKRAIEHRLRADRDRFQTLEDLSQFIATRGNDLVLTPARPVKVVDPEASLGELFAELVGERERQSQPEAAFPELDRIFRQPNLAGRVEFDRRVTVPVLGRTLDIPYAYRNGADNLVLPKSFAMRESAATDAAMRLAVEGDLLSRHPEDGKERRLIVAPTFAGADDEPRIRQTVNGLLAEYHVRVIEPEQLADFAREVERQAHA